ncbi:MAG: hypothetical protein ACHP7O_11665 [Burkholderiales bacterium]
MKNLINGLFATAHDHLFKWMVGNGMVLCAIPSLTDLQNYSVNRAGAEGIRQSLFDHQLYPTAGLVQMNFFVLPIGQGVATALGAAVGSQKTINDTNMEVQGMLPAGKSFLITSIEVPFYAGLSAAASTYTPAVPSVFAAAAAAAVAAQVNDVATFYQAGSLRLFIGSKVYLEEAPLMRFPPKTQLSLDVAIGSNSGTAGEVAAISGKIAGRPYMLEPPIYLQNNQNFLVQLNYPAVVATPSGFNGRVGVYLDGYLYRNSQ